MKKILVISETIFSDRLYDTLGFDELSKLEIDLMSSDEINLLQERYIENIKKKIISRFLFKIFRFIRLIHRYVVPYGQMNSSASDHLKIDTNEWHWTKKNILKAFIFIYSRIGLCRRLSLYLLKILVPKIDKDLEVRLSNYDKVFFFSLGNLKPFFVVPLHNFFKKRNIKTICYIQSWDNPSTKGYALFKPDIILTWTELMRNEIKNYMDYPIKKTYAVGSPLFKDHKLDENRNESILFATKSPKTYPHNSFISEMIAIEAKKNNIDFTVRIHPLAITQKFINESDKILKLSKKYGFKVLLPNIDSNKNLLNKDYDKIANDSFYESTLFISVFSTMNLESVNLGINTINIDFQDEERKDISPRMDIKYDRRQVHNARALSYGCIRNVRSRTELIVAIKDHLLSKKYSTDVKREFFIQNECLPLYDKSVLESFLI